jgi:uncharacterized membrane protein
MTGTNHLQNHVELIAKHEQEFIARRTRAEQLGDSIASFAGSLSFVAIHVSFFAGWIVVNTVHLGAIPQFDQIPFSLLGTCVALEGILLASFILMRQARLAKRADERDHLMLQILLLTEREATAVVQMNRQIADKVGLHDVAKDKDIKNLGQQTSIDEVAQTIQDNISNEP